MKIFKYCFSSSPSAPIPQDHYRTYTPYLVLSVNSLVSRSIVSVLCVSRLFDLCDHHVNKPLPSSPQTTAQFNRTHRTAIGRNSTMEFETIVNPPQEVFEQIVHYTGATEDWSFQLNDYNFWSTNFDQFWLVTVVEKGTNNLVASVSLARWDGVDGPLYSVGMFYCKQEHRGKGFGKPIFKQIMDIVGDDNATLTGVVKMSDKYAKDFGFDKVPDFWHLFSGIKITDVVIPEKVSDQFVTKAWNEVDYESLTAYDRTICTRDRKKIMTGWFNLKDTFTRVVMDLSGKIVGYGTIRVTSGNKLSPAPFYADSLEAAEVLLKELLENIPNWQQYLKLGFLYPEINKDAIRLLERFAKSKDAISTAPFIKSQFTKKFISSPDEKVYSMSDCAHQFV